jgi:hypothetical protein
MTAHDVRVSGTGRLACSASERSARRLDDPAILALARRLVVFNVAGEQIAALMDRARKAIPTLTSAEVVQRVTSIIRIVSGPSPIAIDLTSMRRRVRATLRSCL